MESPTIDSAIEVFRAAYTIWLKTYNDDLSFELWLNLQAKFRHEQMLIIETKGSEKRPAGQTGLSDE